MKTILVSAYAVLILLSQLLLADSEAYAVGVRFSPSFGYGVSTASSRLACTPTNSGQSCIVPIKKFSISWCLGENSINLLSASQKADIANGANAVQLGGSGFTFVHQTDGAACDTAVNNNTVDIEINAANSGLCSGGSTSSSIDAYVCVNPSVGAQLTESVSIPGNFFPGVGNNVSLLHFDLGDISAKCGSDVFACDAMTKHGAAHGFAALIGMGARTDRTDLWTSRSILPFNDSRVLSAGEQCKGQSFNPSEPTKIGKIVGADCSSN